MAKKNFKNTVHLEGRVYDHNLELKTSGPNSKNPGTPFINGMLSIATDNNCTNVVQVHFSYVTAVTKNGKPNETFNILQGILDGTYKMVMKDGAELASLVRLDTAIDLNEWYDNRKPDKPLISVKRNEGGFLHLMNMSDMNKDEKQRARFETDIIITGARRIDANPDNNTPEKMILNGCIFNFRGEVLPVEYTVLHPMAMNYFEGLDASPSNPIFTEVRGVQVSQTIERNIEEESAWGDVSVRTVKSSQKDYVVDWAASEPFMFDDESTILASELKEKMANREIHLAEIKKNQEEYSAKKEAASGAFSTVNDSEYHF